MIEGLTKQLNALPPVPCGITYCPSDDGTYFHALFSYLDGKVIPVKLLAHGCGQLYVGDDLKTPVAYALASQDVYRTLDSLLK